MEPEFQGFRKPKIAEQIFSIEDSKDFGNLQTSASPINLPFRAVATVKNKKAKKSKKRHLPVRATAKKQGVGLV